MNKDFFFSSNTDEWETPDWLFNELDEEFHFTLDAASTDENAKCAKHYTKETDGLKQSWEGETVFCNPPYSRSMQKLFIRKCHEESMKPGTTVVAILPARTETIAFHEHIYGKAEIRFVKGRVRFAMGGGRTGQRPISYHDLYMEVIRPVPPYREDKNKKIKIIKKGGNPPLTTEM